MAIFAFIAFWVILGLGLFFIAMRGGLRGAREALHAQSPQGRRGAFLFFSIAYIGLGIALPALVIASNRSSTKAKADNEPVTLNASQQRGRQLFARSCATCHSLKAAGTNAKVGPNLDKLRPPKALVLNAIAMGRARGNGQMPAGLYDGTDAQDVAVFVAQVAGH